MTKTVSKIRFRAKLFRPAATAKVGSWTFLTLPKDASAKLPSRGMTTVEGTINDFPFRATLEPDGQRSPLAQSEPEDARSCGRRRRRRRHAGDRAVGRGTGTHGAGRSAEGSRGRPESAGVVVGHRAHCAQRLDPLDRLRQAARDSRAAGRQCLRDARCREATRLLLRSVWVL